MNRKDCPRSKRAIAAEIVDNVICTAQKALQSDPHGYFFYTCPKNNRINSWVMNSIDKLSGQPLKWSSIRTFSPQSVLEQIEEYIGSWVLSPHMKYNAQCLNETPIVVEDRGGYCNYLVEFYKPTEECQNPLARAKVYFRVYIPKYMPKDFPVMVTYRFEGFNTTFYALGNRSLDSVKFQCFYIDTILEMKLAFYTEVFECTHAKDCPHCKPIFHKRCV